MRLSNAYVGQEVITKTRIDSTLDCTHIKKGEVCRITRIDLDDICYPILLNGEYWTDQRKIKKAKP
jgi:hypothetical protein